LERKKKQGKEYRQDGLSNVAERGKGKRKRK
jgi:hypothetical protein